MKLISRKVEVTTTYTLLYDPNSPAFIQAFKDYKDCINRSGTIPLLLLAVTYHINQRGVGDMIEGVGYVQLYGKEEKDKKKLELFSGIYLKEDDPDVECHLL